MRLSIAILAILLSFTTATQAQTAKKDTTTNEKSIKYRAEIGYGQVFRHGDFTPTFPYHTLKGGLNVEFPLSLGFGIETGLKYSMGLGKGFQAYSNNDSIKYKYSGHYLDIPARATYTLPIFWGLKLFAYAGPTFNINIAHKHDTSEVGNPPSNSLTNPSNNPFNLNRLNIQLGAGGGLQWKNYRVKSGYDWGLNNLSKNKNRPQRAQGWYVAFEYEF